MAINKIIYGGNTLIDLTGDTVTKDKILSGYTFQNLTAQPKAFAIICATQFTMTTTRYISSIVYDGSTIRGNYLYESSKSQYCQQLTSTSYFSQTYSAGTLTVKSTSSSNGGYFRNGCTYNLIYTY